MIDFPLPMLVERPAIIQQVGHDIAPDPKFAIAFAPGFRKPAVSPATLDFRAFTAYPSDGQTVTFTNVAIGTAAADRYVFVAMPYYNGGTSDYSVASVTIGGVLATKHSQVFIGSGSNVRGGVALFSALVPTGTTASVVVTFGAAGAGYYRPNIAVYRVTGLQSNAPFDLTTHTSGSTNDIPKTFTVNKAKDGIVLLVCHIYGNVNSRTLTGLPQDYMVNPVTSRVYIGGGATVNSAGTHSATISNGTTAIWSLIMASFR